MWLQILVMGPHGVLLGFTAWVWWPKSDEGWRRFGLVMAYLVVFYLVMHYEFAF